MSIFDAGGGVNTIHDPEQGPIQVASVGGVLHAYWHDEPLDRDAVTMVFAAVVDALMHAHESRSLSMIDVYARWAKGEDAE